MLALLVRDGAHVVVEGWVDLGVTVYRQRANTGEKTTDQNIVSVQCTKCMHDQVNAMYLSPKHVRRLLGFIETIIGKGENSPLLSERPFYAFLRSCR